MIDNPEHHEMTSMSGEMLHQHRHVRIKGLVVVAMLALARCGSQELDPELVERALAREAESLRAFAEPLAAQGTPVVEHSYIPAGSADRELVRLDRTVLVRSDPRYPESLLYRVGGMGVDADHNVYVLDNGNARIQVFDRSGAFLGSIGGGRGQGPGQFGPGGYLAVGDDRVIYSSGGDRRLITWDLQGAHLATLRVRHRILWIAATGGGLLSAAWRGGEFPYTLEIGRMSLEGGATALLGRAEYPVVPGLSVTRGTRGRPVNEIPVPEVAVAMGPEGRLYVASTDRYEILAVDLETHEQLWTIRVDWPAMEFTEADKEAVLAEVRERVSDVRESEIRWPTHYPRLTTRSLERIDFGAVAALQALYVDGRGRIFVFPFVKNPRRGIPYPVDIYARDGTFIGARQMPRISWMAARDDFVYGLEENEERELDVVRYHLNLEDSSP